MTGANAINRRMALRRYPDGMPREDDFDGVTRAQPIVGPYRDPRRDRLLRGL